MKKLTALLIALYSITAIAHAQAPLFDPGKKFSIMHGSAIMGDPASFKTLGNGHVGGTGVTTALVPNTGLTIIAGFIEPQQGGQPGGGHSIACNKDEARILIDLLRKGPKWADIAKQKQVGDFAKIIGYVRGDKDQKEYVAVVFVSFSDNSSAIQVEHVIAGSAKKFRFDITQAEKFSQQLEYYLNKAIAETTPTPVPDQAKDKLFN